MCLLHLNIYLCVKPQSKFSCEQGRGGGGAVTKEHRGRAKRAQAGDHQHKNHLVPYCVWVTDFVPGFLLISLKWDPVQVHMACGFEDVPSSE